MTIDITLTDNERDNLIRSMVLEKTKRLQNQAGTDTVYVRLVKPFDRPTTDRQNSAFWIDEPKRVD